MQKQLDVASRSTFLLLPLLKLALLKSLFVPAQCLYAAPGESTYTVSRPSLLVLNCHAFLSRSSESSQGNTTARHQFQKARPCPSTLGAPKRPPSNELSHPPTAQSATTRIRLAEQRRANRASWQ